LAEFASVACAVSSSFSKNQKPTSEDTEVHGGTPQGNTSQEWR